MLTGTIEDCAILGDKLFFLTRELRILYTVDLLSQKCVGLSQIEDDDPYMFYPLAGIGGRCFAWNDSLVITPSINSKIRIYKLSTNEWKSIEIDCIYSDLKISKIFAAALIENNLFLVGCHYPCMIICDLAHGTIETTNEPYQRYSNTDWKRQPFFARYGNIRNKDFFRLFSTMCNEALNINLSEKSYQWEIYDDRYIRENSDVECIFKELEPGIVFNKQFMDGSKVLQTTNGTIRIVRRNCQSIEINPFCEFDYLKESISSVLNTKGKEKFLSENKILMESQTIGLNEFLMMVK